MKVKLKDLELAMEYIQTNRSSEWAEFEESKEAGQPGITLSFIDKANKIARILIYDVKATATPEVQVTTKLYKTDKP